MIERPKKLVVETPKEFLRLKILVIGESKLLKN
jgi:hypothetical protein